MHVYQGQQVNLLTAEGFGLGLQACEAKGQSECHPESVVSVHLFYSLLLNDAFVFLFRVFFFHFSLLFRHIAAWLFLQFTNID